MLKHFDLLEKLDPLRKAALVASGLEDEALAQAGLPPVGRVSLGELARERGVSYEAAARSFDPGLVGRMTEELVAEGCAEGDRLFVTPDLKAAVDPYTAGLSEDPCLSGLYGAAIVRAVHEQGAAVGLARFSLGGRDIAYLDRREDAGAVHDLFVKPFLAASAAAPCDAVLLTPNRAGGGYPDTNRALFSDVLGGYLGDVFAIGDGVAPTADALGLLRGKVTLGGAALPLERAAKRFSQLKKYREEGSITEHELNDALRSGSALDEEKLDGAADDVIDFALRLSSHVPVGLSLGDDGRRELAAASIVLLKNEKILPLARGTRIAVVGEAYADLSPLEERFSVAGRAQGYERTEERSDSLIPEAVRATNGADVVLVFLYPDASGRSLALPANRVALLDAVKKTKKRVVALVCGDLPADMRFDADLDGVLLVPGDGPFAAEALAKVLAGEADAAGRLSRTAYDDPDGYFASLAAMRDAGRIRIGGFAGYLRYDTAGEGVRYPFGYGLSYTKFSYSSLSVEGEKVSFTVKNTGGRDGVEVAQVYVGAPSETRVAPRKQLKAVCKLALKAGESRRVTVELSADDFATFDARTLADNTEGGLYRIYVCSDALTVKLQGKRVLEGTEREPTGETPADFFPDFRIESAAKVKKESRMGEGSRENVPKALRAVRTAALVVFPVTTVLFFLLITLFIFAFVLDYSLFYAFDEEIVKWSIYGIAVLLIAMLPLLGSFNRRRLTLVRNGAIIATPVLLFLCLMLGIFLLTGRGAEEERIIMTVVSCFALGIPMMAAVAAIAEHVLKKSGGGTSRWAKYYFSREKKETVTGEAEFEAAFREAEAAKEERTPPSPVEERAEVPAEPLQFFDKELSYSELLRDCTLFAAERGIGAEEETMRNFLAALSATRLIILPEGSGALLAGAVAEYFGKRAYIDNAEQYVQSSDLFTQWRQAERIYLQTDFSMALEDAKKEGAFLHIAILRHFAAARLAQVFGGIADAVARRKASVTLPDGSECVLPPNLCFVLEVGREDIGKIPPSIAEAAAVLFPVCTEKEPAERKSVVQSVGYERFAAMRRAVRDEFPLGDGVWKNVDLLDERCRSAHIGNLSWIKMEVHAAVVAACGGTEEKAIDGALAAELLPWFSSVWDEERCGETLSGALASLFGKDIGLCKEFLRSGGDGTTKL